MGKKQVFYDYDHTRSLDGAGAEGIVDLLFLYHHCVNVGDFHYAVEMIYSDALLRHKNMTIGDIAEKINENNMRGLINIYIIISEERGTDAGIAS